MLKSSMEKIAQCAAQEVSGLGSSLESLYSEGEASDSELIQVSEEESELECEEADSNSDDRELRNPYTIFLERKRQGCKTPPYLSPGVSKRIAKTCVNTFIET